METKDVFISYSSKQGQIAFATCEYLEKFDIRCWIAPRDIPSGSNYTLEIPKGLQECKVLVLIFSNTASQSQWVSLEIMSALNNNLTIIPFRVEDYPMDANAGLYFMLQKSQWIDAFPNFENKLDDLRKDIEKIIGKKSLNLTPTDPTDQYNLGMNYYTGTYLPKDILLARKWFTLSAKQGHIKSMKMLGEVYLNNLTYNKIFSDKYYRKAAENGDFQSQLILGKSLINNQDFLNGISWIEKAAQGGAFEAYEFLADAYFYGKNIDKDYRNAYLFAEKAVVIDSAKALYLLGLMNLYGLGRDEDHITALKYLNRSAQKSHTLAYLELAKCYLNGWGVEKNSGKAIDCLRNVKTGDSFALQAELFLDNKKTEAAMLYYKAALAYEKEGDRPRNVEMLRNASKLGCVDAMADLGDKLIEDCLYEEGFQWLSTSSDMNSPKAKYLLGLLYRDGIYVEQDFHQAFILFEEASLLCNKEALFFLALCYLNGEGVSQNGNKAMQLLQSTININSIPENPSYFERVYGNDICRILGKAYHLGWGGEKDFIKAIYYLDNQLISTDGDVCLELAEIYDEGGHGIEHNKMKALFYRQQAAMHGHPIAEFFYGTKYENNQWVRKDISERLEILEKASEEGDAKATALLGDIYRTGMEVDIDLDKAKSYYELAYKRGMLHLDKFLK